MAEIKCPKCGEVFQVDESGYEQIVRQVRDKEFAKELERREGEQVAKREQALEILRLAKDKERSEAIAINNSAHNAAMERNRQELDSMKALVARLQAKLASGQQDKELAVSEALRKQQTVIESKNSELSLREQKITELKAKLQAGVTEKQLAVAQARAEKDSELNEKSSQIMLLQGELKNKDSEKLLSENSLKEQYENQLKQKDELINYYKDFKARQSTKMIGESLEQHCLNSFNSLRMTAFPNAYFEKDNDARSGSKGDFIYRESGEDGTEFISIMFEMKNEADGTASKHKNEDFFKELDKDRREKNCEYAILVSLLEIDNDYYNEGIVDVSYKYPKMYVIRPQFFIPVISFLRNAAQNSLKYRQELQLVKNQQIDILHFEENLKSFKDGFGRNYRLASDKFKLAIEEIDKTIDHLQKTKNALLSSENNLRLANNKADEITIKKLTKDAPSVKAMFEDLHKA
jgi:hypothetical protein